MANEEKHIDLGSIGRMVFDGALAIVVAATGWYMTQIWNELKELKQTDISIRAEASAVRERLPIDYVRKEEYRGDIAEIKRLLESMDRKLDRKADRFERGTAVGPGVWRDGRDVNR